MCTFVWLGLYRCMCICVLGVFVCGGVNVCFFMSVCVFVCGCKFVCVCFGGVCV